MKKNNKPLHRSFFGKPLTALCVPIAAITTPISITCNAQEKESALQLEEIIVTAQRREERLQDVPISITVFDQTQIDNRQVTDTADLAQYVPGLGVDTTYGRSNGSFTIRGFTRESRTSAAVAVYFADAVSPRGGTSQFSGDGAGPGAFFDLQNVQVLRGPQGTLFGRNTTGGAVLLVPQKPTEEFEGYVTVGGGNYNQVRTQGVVNIPVADTFRVRLGVDHQKRDGYIENLSDYGPDDFDNMNYTSWRASAVWDVTDSIENYTVMSLQTSDTNGDLATMYDGTTASAFLDLVFGGALTAQGERYQQSGKWYAGENGIGNPTMEFDQLRIINNTKWDVSDSFSIKNILAYSTLETKSNTAIFGTAWVIPDFYGPPLAGTIPNAAVSAYPQGGATTDNITWSEELQFFGTTGKLQWQAGLYYEETTNDGLQGSLSPSAVDCGAKPNDLNCFDTLLAATGFAPGSLNASLDYVEYENFGVYAQGTYDLTEKLGLTVGLRYTDDKVNAQSQSFTYRGFPSDSYGPPTFASCQQPGATNPIPVGVVDFQEILNAGYCERKQTTSSDAPTWLVNLDYRLTDDILVYGKYVRGYRQGSLNPAAPIGLEAFGPEEVDMFELGMKSDFDGPIPGRFNVALFYNDFNDQQISVGYVANPTAGAPSTASPINAGSSEISGFEVEATLLPHEYVRFDLSYGYLDTELKELATVENPDTNLYLEVLAQAEEGGPLALSPKNKYSLTGTFGIPIADELGNLNFSVTYSYTDEYRIAIARPGVDDFSVVNVNANWDSIAGSAFNLAFFVTNATDEEYIIHEGSTSLGSNRRVGPPRMYGMTLNYNFGAN